MHSIFANKVKSVGSDFLFFKNSTSHFEKLKIVMDLIENLGHLTFNRHFLKSIFDLLTLNRFPNGFLHCTRGRPKNSRFFSSTLPTPNPLLHFFGFPLLGFWSLFVLRALRHLKFSQTRYFSTALDNLGQKKFRYTPKAVGVRYRKPDFFLK